MPPRPASKRAAESRPDVGQPSEKRTRFVEPAEDPARFAEQVDAALEDAPAARSRRRVRTDGYDSDSSDDGEGPRRGAKKGAKDGEDEDEDMFAMADKVDKPDEDGAKKKKEEFLRLGDIEGQEFNEADGDGDEDDASDDEGEPEDEDDAIRRSKAGMGFELSGFNMRDEMEEGKFTEDGSYVRSFDAHSAHDRWMEGVDDRAIKQARRRKREREKAERERQKAEERELEDAGGKPQVERDLLAMLKKGETVLEALQRLGALAKKAKKLEKGKHKAAPEATTDSKQPDANSFSPIDHVTHLASMLLSLGDTEIYSRTYEELVRSVRASGKVPQDWSPPSADVKYEFRWAVPDATAAPGQVFGPYDDEEMKAWYKADYFGPGAEKVEVRTVGGEWGFWDDVVV